MKILKNDPAYQTLLDNYNNLISTYQDTDILSLLCIQSSQTLIVTKDEELNTIIIVLNLGTDTIGAIFNEEPPPPEEIEKAINIIEDELMLAVRVLGPDTELCSKDVFLKTIINLAYTSATSNNLSRVAMEALFTRFAVISMGRSPQTDAIPVNASFSANMLILREIMHHLKFEKILVV
ncbi:MAG: hypothetical protein P4L28_01470 [Paludibacteraceae bacterium]|nr:hypothetical protein [Paludibacteraceae bacterium]